MTWNKVKHFLTNVFFHQLSTVDSSNDFLFLGSAYKISKETPFIYEKFGLWNQQKGLIHARETRIVSRRRRNLQGHLFKAAAVYIYEGSENHVDLDDYKFDPFDIIFATHFR